jgi:hypothetical protein
MPVRESLHFIRPALPEETGRAGLRRTLVARFRQAMRLITSTAPTRWFALLLILLLSAFLVVLLTEPTAGRGGR